MIQHAHIIDSKDELQRWCERCGEKIKYQFGEASSTWKSRKLEFRRQHNKCKRAQ